ncbi:MAG: hypothetical protein Q9166_005288 [cf. Caloplaca sp. 2 TL-2023]
MTRRDILSFFHEPFGDAFYYGPEKISPAHLRWPEDKIEKSGRGHYTYDYVLQSILSVTGDSRKRVFLKDMSYHIIPPIHTPAARPPSLEYHFESNEDRLNPTLLPTSILRAFTFVFLVRKPEAAIPSLYRCFIPPLSSKTDEHMLDPTELGYRELRILFDYLRREGGETPILIDADDLLSEPDAVIRDLCARLEIPYKSSMLSWPSADDYDFAKCLFEKYAGYHEDALNSKGLRPRSRDELRGRRSRKEEDEEWEGKYGREAMETIRGAVDLCREDYEYLRRFRMGAGGGERRVEQEE